jgi:hypothetical protein
MPNWSIPYGDPYITFDLEKDGSTLTTDDAGHTFVLNGNVKLIALAVLEYALQLRNWGTNICFSRFEFYFEGSTIGVKEHPERKSSESLLVVEEIRKLIKLKAFF